MTENRYHVEVTMSTTKTYVIYAHSKNAAIAEAKKLITDDASTSPVEYTTFVFEGEEPQTHNKE